MFFLVYSTVIFHANLQYAEIPVEEIPNVVQQSYIPVLTTLLEIPKIEVVLNFTGVTLEILNNEYPEVLDLMKEGIDKGKFEITGTGYSHPIFPLIPIEDSRKQIEFNLQVLEKTLNYKPTGFWLPELAYDPTLPYLLKEYGFSYIFIDEELYRTSSPLLNYSNPSNLPYKTTHQYVSELNNSKNFFSKMVRYRRILSEFKKRCKRVDFSPVELKGAKSTITGLKVPTVWSVITQACMYGYPFVSFKKITRFISKHKKQNGLIIPFGTDIEFIGYRSLIEGKLITPEKLKKLLTKILKIEGNEMILPKEYLKKYKPTDLGYMKTGSWGPDLSLDLWTKDEDNQKLERLCEEIRWYFRQLLPEEIDEKIWKHLLLAENSDGRGWDPIPERRLACFSHALEALNLVKELYREKKLK
jgi:predicted glycosyl hydrolase (DUF1957 family)